MQQLWAPAQNQASKQSAALDSACYREIEENVEVGGGTWGTQGKEEGGHIVFVHYIHPRINKNIL